jgi:GT2 family glycosyltransferase
LGDIGVVVIGRNEGDRLRACLRAVAGQAAAIVYVDSGSGDGSVEYARDLGVETIDLDLSRPFTAARARNEGLDRLFGMRPNLEFVQFVDGDCEIVDGWLERARSDLASRPDAAVVCGRRRERFPETLYNRLCDMKWDTPVGEAAACGGDALMRAEPVRQVGGYRAALIAGEEPELCLRLRAAGWKVWRIDAEMSRHDAGMTRFGQWWRRAVRAGHAFAEVSWLHRTGAWRLWVRETRSNWFWGLLLPAAALAPAYWTGGLSLLLGLGYPLLAFRVYRGRRGRGEGRGAAAWYALFCVLGKFAHVAGQMRFHLNRLLARPGRLIEYKQLSRRPVGEAK